MEIRSVSSSLTSDLNPQGQPANVKVALEREVKLFDRREQWLANYKVSFERRGDLLMEMFMLVYELVYMYGCALKVGCACVCGCACACVCVCV